MAAGETLSGHDVFVSHSHNDAATANAICNALESHRIRCWMAPRDVPPGATWSAAIIDAISQCRVMVLIFSSHSNHSDQVLREVTCAVDNGAVIIPFRVEDVEMSKNFRYFLAPLHWLDAVTPPLTEHVGKLAQRIESLLQEKPILPHRQAGTAMEPSPAAAVATQESPEAKAPAQFSESPEGQTPAESTPARHPLWAYAGLAAFAAVAAIIVWLSVKARPDGDTVAQPPATVQAGQPVTVDVSPSTAHEAGELMTVELPGAVPLDMVWIPPGEFMMGSLQSEVDRDTDEMPQHRVTFAQGFWMGKCEVTQAQWQAVMGNNPSSFKGDGRLPVEMVSWDDCREFIKRLNGKGQRTFRLPSEAEWEYACRAGTTTRFAFGETISTDQANHDGDYTYESERKGATIPVGSLQRNAWGLYNMHGNVSEWCQDWHHNSYYGAPADGSAWQSPAGSKRVKRGGSFDYDSRNCRSAHRGYSTPVDRDPSIGFRLLRVPDDDKVAQLPATVQAGQPATVDVSLFTAYVAGELMFAELPGDVRLEMLWVPAGEFMMGGLENEEGRASYEMPRYQVRISRGFWLGRYEVTQAQWQAVMGKNFSNFEGDDLPVEMVSWDDCQDFVYKLNSLNRRRTGTFRLPSEAEWEYACRASMISAFAFGNTISPDQANYNGKIAYRGGPRGIHREKTTPVGTFRPNMWGLFDMHGNVWEWCQDSFHDSYDAAPQDGSAWETPEWETSSRKERVKRGGSWDCDPSGCRSAVRSFGLPFWRADDIGFRVAFSPAEEST